MGVLISSIRQAFPPKSTFAVDDIPDLSGQVHSIPAASPGNSTRPQIIIVTGANSGVGKETVKVRRSSSCFHGLRTYVIGPASTQCQGLSGRAELGERQGGY